MKDAAFGCVNNTIRLRSGHYFDLADPKPDQFEFSDIAGALSKICRFGGQSPFFYSVAEHLWHCCEQATADGLHGRARQAVLMHDATEAFVGDMVKPLKVMLPDYDRVEEAVERAIGLRFGIDFERERKHVRKIDREMLIAERRFMFGGDGVKWTGEDDVRAIRVPIAGWSPDAAERWFTQSADLLGINR